MFWNILLFLFFIFRSPVLAGDTSIVWSTGANDGKLGEQFDVNVKVSSTTSGTFYIRADDGNDCSLDILYNNSWSNACYVGTDAMPSVTVDANGSTEVTLRLRVRNTASAKTYTLYSYIYDSGRNKLGTSSSRSITINSVPTATPTSSVTSTPTPTQTPTLTPTPTIKTTPTPTEAPIMEPTQAIVSSEETITPTPTVASLTIENSKKKSISLPLVFIIFGLLMFIVPVFGPKLADFFKSKKKKGPPPIMPPTMEETLPPMINQNL